MKQISRGVKVGVHGVRPISLSRRQAGLDVLSLLLGCNSTLYDVVKAISQTENNPGESIVELHLLFPLAYERQAFHTGCPNHTQQLRRQEA